MIYWGLMLMTRKLNESKQFGFGINIIKDLEGQEYLQTVVKNSGVSTEIVAMQLRAYLRIIEDDYAEDFKNNYTIL